MHPLVRAQRFARAEYRRGLEGLSDEEARFRADKADGGQMNCISWTAGHLAAQEAAFFVVGVGKPLDPRLEQVFTGRPATTPHLDEVLALWEETTARADEFLETADDEALAAALKIAWAENLGTALMRSTYHYWFHAGEVNATRQLLGHPEIIFVGPMQGRLEYPLQP
jgi:hypothetical protein